MLFSVLLTPGGTDNGTSSTGPIGTGLRGSYLELTRTWTDGDRLHFSLPMQLRVTQYTGLTTIPGHERFAVELGPILLCAVGGVWNHSIDSMLVRGVASPLAPETWLTPPASILPPARHYSNASSSSDAQDEFGAYGSGGAARQSVSSASKRASQMDALRFGVAGNSELSFVPYFLVQEEEFEVYPAFERA